MKKILLPIILAAFSLTTFGQTNSKLGHVNINEILVSLSVTDSIQSVLENETKEIESIYEEMQVAHNVLLEEYNNGLPGYSEIVRKTKEDEIRDQQRRLQEFEQTANQTLQQRNSELVQPVYNDIYKAIEKIATELSLEYVLDLSKGSVVFTSEESFNINAQVIEAIKNR